MKTLFFLLISYFVTFSIIAAELPSTKSVKNYSYIVRIQTPQTVKKNHIKGYYKGTLLRFDDSWCLLPEDQKCFTFSLIITPSEVEPVCEGNTTRYLKRNPNIACAWYDLTLQLDPHQKSGYTWTIEQKDLTKVPLRLPEHSILLYTSPDFIDSIKHIETENTNPSTAEKTVINFPTIIFKNKIDQELFEESSITALLASLDLDTIHTSLKKENKKDQHIVLSMLSKQ